MIEFGGPVRRGEEDVATGVQGPGGEVGVGGQGDEDGEVGLRGEYGRRDGGPPVVTSIDDNGLAV